MIFRVGGRGLCVGAAQNNAGKTALSRNGTRKNCDSPINPRDLQASITIRGGCPLF
jgi:hypothetical protein